MVLSKSEHFHHFVAVLYQTWYPVFAKNIPTLKLRSIREPMTTYITGLKPVWSISVSSPNRAVRILNFMRYMKMNYNASFRKDFKRSTENILTSRKLRIKTLFHNTKARTQTYKMYFINTIYISSHPVTLWTI